MRFRVALAVLLLSAAPLAHGAGIRASVRSRDVSVNQLFMIQVEVEGNDVGDVLLPQSDDFGFTPEPAVRGSSTNISVANGQIKQVNLMTLGYTAWAKRAGELTLPPLRVHIDGKEYQSQPIKITARKAGETSRGAPRGQNPPRNSTSAPDLEDAFRLESSVDKTEVFQGEPIVLSVRLLQLQNPNVDVMGRSQLQMPATEGFFASPQQQFEDEVMRDGWAYSVQEVRQILFPTGVGEYTIGEAVWDAQVRALTYLGLRPSSQHLKTEPITIKVKALPDRPEGFSGAVGQFDVNLGIKDQTLTQGVPTQLEFTVRGRGNPNAIKEPALPEMSWAHLSGPEVDTQHDEQDWALIRKTFLYTLTPLKAGSFQIPSFKFIHFYPPKASYDTQVLPALPVQVEASEEGSQLVALGGTSASEQQAVKILSEGIQPLLTAPRALYARSSAAAPTTAAMLFPPMGYLAFWLLMRRRHRFASDPAYARRHAAVSRARKRLGQLPGSREPSDDLYRAVIGYVADHFNASETGMTAQDAAGLLEREGVPADLREQFLRVLRACERRRYGGGDLSPSEVQALAHAAQEAVNRLEHEHL